MRAMAAVRRAPVTLRPVSLAMRCAGRVRPVRFAGSVKLLEETLEEAEQGDILVIDNAGRSEEACVGELFARKASHAGLGGIVVWGAHGDSAELEEIGLPIFSLGAPPAGLQKVNRRPSDFLPFARVGNWVIDSDDLVVGDADGVIFFPGEQLSDVLRLSRYIRRERPRFH
jgi:4-hydroxy-4-methyl-2-oxoglutarate aldolase